MNPTRVDHIGIGVPNLEEACKFYEALGLVSGGTEIVADQKVKVAFFPCGDSELELLESTAPDGPIAKFLEKNGGHAGIQHVAIRVPDIRAAIAEMKEKGYAILSEGAWVIPVAEETDKKAVPPCILVKSDGSSIYATTDLATMVQRMQDWHPDKMLYVTDKRQALHFEQVFRAARKCGIVPDTTALEHIGHGTMNGKDGKPFKTRDGGVLRLETLIADMTAFVRAKVVENQIVDASEVDDTTAKIALAALKYGDLSNQPTKDYNFDLERFAAFEGNTGPYILYTIVRIKSILAKYGDWAHLPIQPPANPFAKDLMNVITRLQPTLETALASSAPNLICAYIYELAGAVNKFYHETPVLKEADETLKAGHIALLGLAKNILETCIHILGFSAPEKM